MASASITIEQNGVRGAASTSRDDLALAQPVTLRNANDSGVRSWRWSIKIPKGSAATLSNVTAAAPVFTPDVAGTYVVSLAINEGLTGQTDRRLATVRNPSVTIGATTYDTRYIGIGEDGEANWTVDLGAGPVTNTTGWWEDLDRWQRLTQAAAAVAGTGEANTASNLGAGTGVFATKSGLDLEFKSLKSSDTSITISATGTEIDLVAAAAGGSATGLPGNIYDSLVFYVDAADRNSYSGSGASVTDLLGNGTGGTLTGATYNGGAFQFDGASGDLTFTKGAALDDIFAGGGTVLVIARPYNAGETVGNVVQTGSSKGWRIQTDTVDENTARLEFNHSFAGGQLLVETYRQTSDADPTPTNTGGASALPFPFKEGNYNAVAVVYDSDALANDPTIYFNGTSWTTTLGLQKIQTPTLLPATSDVGNDLVIGNRVADDRTFEGDIAVVLMFNRALTRNEVIQVTSLFAPRFGIGTIGQNGTGLTTAEDVRGQNVLIRGGDGQDEGQGGCVTILGGDTDPTQNSGNRGGDILIRAGSRGNPVVGDPGNTTVAAGYGDGAGVLTLAGGDIAGNSTNLSAVDTVIIHGADAVDAPASPSGSSYGGRVLIRGGFSGYTRPCGSVTVRGGEALDSPVGATYGTVEGGDVTVRGGDGLGNRAGGTLTLKSGDAGGTSGTGGVVLATGVNTSTGGAFTPPDIDIICSPCQVAGAGSAVKIQAGDNLASSNGDGGFVTATAGDSADGDGGSITLTAGESASTDAADPGGSITLTAGNQTAGSGGSAGGSITLTTGTSTSGNGGSIELDGPLGSNAEGVKFGTITPGAVASGSVLFATAFSSAPRIIQLSLSTGASGAGTLTAIASNTVSASGFSWATAVALNGTTDTIHWTAIL